MVDYCDILKIRFDFLVKKCNKIFLQNGENSPHKKHCALLII
jgi:hypothetical protein